MNCDLLRQRRNLLLISGFLIIFDFAHVDITKVSLLGTELVIGRPEVLINAVWFLWVYFFLRYYQYLREENNLKIKSTFIFHFKGLALNHVEKCRIAKGLEKHDLQVFQEGLFNWDVKNNTYNSDNTWTSVTGALPRHYVVLWYIKSFFHLIMNTSKITDRVLPIIIAILAPIIKIFL